MLTIVVQNTNNAFDKIIHLYKYIKVFLVNSSPPKSNDFETNSISHN